MAIIKEKLLKVCKIDSISFASFAIKQNVDFLGIHILEKENIGEHKELTDFIKSKKGKPVIVTKIRNEDVLTEVVQLYKPDGLQFHFEIEPKLTSKIKRKFPKILLFGVLSDHSTFLDFSTINELFDFVIYDTSYTGGTNEKNNYIHINKFPYKLRVKTLLAGGITTDRIKELNYLETGGYDIQSYFRTEDGLNFKNLDKICDLLKFPRKRVLSVSLTDISLNEIKRIGSYYFDSNLEYHLDFSPGTLYPSFNTIANSIEEKQQHLVQLPYSIHLFIKDIDELRDKIKKLNGKYPLNIIRIFVQYSKDIPNNFFSEKLSYISKTPNVHYKNSEGTYTEMLTYKTTDIKLIPSVFFKDLKYYLDQSIDSPILSIVVPNPEDKNYVQDFISFFNSQKEALKEKEIWFDRNLNIGYIKYLQENIGFDFNFIIGKEVISDWNKINLIHEQLLKEK